MLQPPTHPAFTGPDAPADEDLYKCVHCGLCLNACPTYVQLGVETESPRGRISLMKAVKEGRLGITDRVASHWELCLQCRACETACPSGVPFGRLMEYTRAQTNANGAGGLKMRLVRWAFLRGALGRLGRLRFGARLLRVYQRWGLQKLVRASRLLRLLPGGVHDMEKSLPQMADRFFGPSPETRRSLIPRRMTVALLSGCVMPLVQADTMEATVRVLTRNGCDTTTPVGQGCCGALSLHSGELESARSMARKNIDVFLSAGVEKVVVASAGCGSAMKEYGELLKDDASYSERARQLSEMTVDVIELLADLPLEAPKGEVRRKVTYQDPCHLAHAQGITRAPRALLEAIPGLELVEMEDSTRCCGAAGIYSMVQKEMSGRVLDSKMEAVAATAADCVATANPGCMIQIETGIAERGMNATVCHVVDLLDEAYRNEELSG